MNKSRNTQGIFRAVGNCAHCLALITVLGFIIGAISEAAAEPKSFAPAQPFDAGNIFVLGSDGKLWFEHGPFGNVPPMREQVDANVRSFQLLGWQAALVLGTDHNLWLEHAPFGYGIPRREQVDGNVR
jgi:hypothetical protein